MSDGAWPLVEAAVIVMLSLPVALVIVKVIQGVFLGLVGSHVWSKAVAVAMYFVVNYAGASIALSIPSGVRTSSMLPAAVLAAVGLAGDYGHLFYEQRKAGQDRSGKAVVLRQSIRRSRPTG